LVYFAEYNTVQCTKRNTYRKKIRDEAREATQPKSTDPNAPDTATSGVDGDVFSASASSDSHPHPTLSSTTSLPTAPNSAMSVDALLALPRNAGEPASKKVRRSDGAGTAATPDGDDDEEDEDGDSQETLEAGEFEDDVDGVEGEEPELEDEEEDEEVVSEDEDEEGGEELVEDVLEERVLKQGEVMDEAMDDDDDEDGEESD
jgi:DNA polymerase epsilon subunit 3